jgi:hypothetical protein
MERKTKEEKENIKNRLEMKKIKKEIGRTRCPYYAPQGQIKNAGRCHNSLLNHHGNHKHYIICPHAVDKSKCTHFMSKMASLEPWRVKKEGEIDYSELLGGKK